MRSRVRAVCVQRAEFVGVAREKGLCGGGWSAEFHGRGDLRRRPRVVFVAGVGARGSAVVVVAVVDVRGTGIAEREAEVVEVRVWGWF